MHTTLEAFAEARRRCPWAKLHLVGSGPEEVALRHGADRLDIADAVTFHGWLEQAEALRLIASAECVVLPSMAEGTPISLLEAMARAVPVVATPWAVPRICSGRVVPVCWFPWGTCQPSPGPWFGF